MLNQINLFSPSELARQFPQKSCTNQTNITATILKLEYQEIKLLGYQIPSYCMYFLPSFRFTWTQTFLYAVLAPNGRNKPLHATEEKHLQTHSSDREDVLSRKAFQNMKQNVLGQA